MEFWDVHVFANAELYEDILVLVEELECIHHVLEGCIIMSGVLCEVDEVKQCAECEHDIIRSPAYQTAQEDACYVLALAPRNLRE